MVRFCVCHCRKNVNFAFAFFFGTLVSSLVLLLSENQCISPDIRNEIKPDVPIILTTPLNINDYEPRINLAGKPQKAQKTPQVLIRPRYYSTELGIKEKLFVGVLSTYETVTSLGMAINKTVAHYVNKILFFIESPNRDKLNISLPGLVVFTETRKLFKPFHMLKYIADNYLDEYDFYFFIKDTTFVKTRDLMSFVNNISVSEDVHAGGGDDQNVHSCSLDTGILLSNFVVKQIASNLDWCVKNVLYDENNNVGRCVFHATGKPCKAEVQGQPLRSYMLPNNYWSNINNPIHPAVDLKSAVTLYPVLHPEMFYELDKMFSKMSLLSVEHNIAELRHSINTMSSLAPGGQEAITWPVGNQPSSVPVTRFDVVHWEYFDEKNHYQPSDFSNLKKLQGATKLDTAVVLNATVLYVEQMSNGKYQFHKLLRGYRRFDPSRGLDYVMDLSFIDTFNAQEIHKRIEVCKPLGEIELVPMPYVMEKTRINMILPVVAGDLDITKKFMEHYASVCMEKRDKTFLMLVLLYHPTDSPKGTKDDVFMDIKQLALTLSSRYKRDGSTIAWFAINIPSFLNDDTALLEFAIADLVVKKFSQDSLILLCKPNVDIRQDYLNRVRMNTIIMRQIFSPIPFTEFNPDIAYSSVPPRNNDFDINKNHGHYDVFDVHHISFYVKDYLISRKHSESVIPIFHTDRDLLAVFSRYQNMYRSASKKVIDSLYSMFISYSNVHILRSVEPSLRLRYVDKRCSKVMLAENTIYDKCMLTEELNLGTRSQLARVILDYQ